MHPENFQEIFERLNFEEKKTLHNSLKKKFKSKEESHKRCSQIFVGFLMLVLAIANIAFIYLSFHKDLIQLVGGFIIFSCFLFMEIINTLKKVPCCSLNMINLLKYSLGLGTYVFFLFIGMSCKAESKDYEMSNVICGVMLGFLFAILFGNEIKKFCKKKI